MSKKNAAGRAATAATTTICNRNYPIRRPLSSPHLQKIYPGRKDRALPRPPAGASRNGSTTATSLGLLVLLLSARANELPAQQVRQGWRLAETWLSQVVAARLRGVSHAC